MDNKPKLPRMEDVPEAFREQAIAFNKAMEELEKRLYFTSADRSVTIRVTDEGTDFSA